jgi:hypothetical protein
VERLIQRLLNLQIATKDLDTVGRRDLLEHDLVLQQIANLTGQFITDCFIPKDQLEAPVAVQLGENDEVVDRRTTNISMKGPAFKECLSRSINRARQIASTHP